MTKHDQDRGFHETEWIPVKNLSIVWTEAQRPLNKLHAQRLADNFDPDMFGTISVTKPNGKGIYHVIDGQHRVVAVTEKWGHDEKVPCQVFDAVDPSRAAQIFDSVNSGRRALQPIELFKVRVTAGKELQVEVNKIVIKCGYFVGHRNANSIQCVGALEVVYQSYGPIVLEATLRLIRKMWGEENSACGALIVRGIGMLLSEFRHLDFERLATAISSKYTPARLLGAAKTAKEMAGGVGPTIIRDILVARYNSQVRGDKNKLRVGIKK
jgi:hypothetical protein